MGYGDRGRYRGGRRGYGGSYGGGSRYGAPSMSGMKKPVEMGKEYNVEITEISRRGDGVAKLQNFVIFVKEGKVGDKPRIKIESVGPRFAIASIVGKASSDVSDENTNTGSSVEQTATPERQKEQE